MVTCCCTQVMRSLQVASAPSFGVRHIVEHACQGSMLDVVVAVHVAVVVVKVVVSVFVVVVAVEEVTVVTVDVELVLVELVWVSARVGCGCR